MDDVGATRFNCKGSSAKVELKQNDVVKLKVQAAIQGDSVRVTGAKRDDLQAAMALIRKGASRNPLFPCTFGGGRIAA